MSIELSKQPLQRIAIAPAIEKALVMGDLSAMTPDQRVSFYKAVCESVGLNPLTRPFDYIILNGKLTLYARKDATDQLRRLHAINVEIMSREFVDDLYIVKAKATAPDGRTDESLGALSIASLKGEAKANAIMKAETKAKRRVTLSICGLGILDETEAEPRPRKQRFYYADQIANPAAAQLEASPVEDYPEEEPAAPTVTVEPTKPGLQPMTPELMAELLKAFETAKDVAQIQAISERVKVTNASSAELDMLREMATARKATLKRAKDTAFQEEI